MRKANEVVAIVGADLHLHHFPPVARREHDGEWYQAMRRPLREVQHLCDIHRAPFLVAGDIFHTWREPPELVNFVIAQMPRPCYAIPGQHDLPYHSYDDMKKSAFWTLVEAGAIRLIPPYEEVAIDGLSIQGFPWGFKPEPCTKGPLHPFGVRVALIHCYLWIKDRSFFGAPKDKHLKRTFPHLRGHDVAVFGDNHKPFLVRREGTTVINCGSFMRRHSDEIDHQPSVGLVYANGDVKRYYLNTSADNLSPLTKPSDPTGVDMEVVINEMRNLGDLAVDFIAAVIEWLESNHIDEVTKRLILKSLPDKGKK